MTNECPHISCTGDECSYLHRRNNVPVSTVRKETVKDFLESIHDAIDGEPTDWYSCLVDIKQWLEGLL